MEINNYRIDFVCKMGETFFVDIEDVKTGNIYEFYQNENEKRKNVFIFNRKSLSKTDSNIPFEKYDEYEIEWNKWGEILIFNEIN